jgi:hypothetical protein
MEAVLQTHSTERSCSRKKLLDLRSGLVRLHVALIMAEQVTYERINGRVTSPRELLDLVINNPWFTWLHPFFLLVHRIDQLLDDEFEFLLVEVEHFLRVVRSLICPSEEGDGFARSYYEALQREPDVIYAHIEVEKLLTNADPQPMATAAVRDRRLAGDRRVADTYRSML